MSTNLVLLKRLSIIINSYKKKHKMEILSQSPVFLKDLLEKDKELLNWFGPFFRSSTHKVYLENLCLIKIASHSSQKRQLYLSENSFILTDSTY